ncbi:MAG: histidine triad nucleotide-binding protein [Spirochaetaceae bacterium]|jgi:histidine triad (HIT) family protein|nr:histidine triad nucleotide-binding protein [Spirochaetaceae bacterium]
MDCIFCKIAAGEIPAKKIFEDNEMLVFHDIEPKAPVHFLVIPKRHISSMMECTAEDSELLGRLLFRAQETAWELGCGDNGARFVINCKSDGGQTVEHLHIHALGGRKLEWPPG